MSDSAKTVLEVSLLVKHFGGLRALDGCSFTVKRGEVVGVIGPNGAGKSTAVEVVAGGLRPESGKVLLEGQDVTGWSRRQMARAGLIRTFQLPRLVERAVALENVMAAEQRQRGENWVLSYVQALWRHQELQIEGRARSFLSELGVAKTALQLAGQLSGGQGKLIEVARGLAGQPRVLVLDEPVSGVNPKMIGELVGAVRGAKALGCSVLLVEHNLGFVEAVCDRVVVMVAGNSLTEGTLADVRQNQLVIDAYLGRG